MRSAVSRKAGLTDSIAHQIRELSVEQVLFPALTMNYFHPTTTTYKAGAKTLPGKFYTSEEIFEKEIDKIFSKSWNCVGRADQIKSSGDYLVRSIAGESIIIVRDSKNKLNAFFNVCRHRGTQLCNTSNGHFVKHIQCPYHAWTYETGGKLVDSPHMHEVKGFLRGEYGLHKALVAIWEGFIFVNTAKKPKSFDNKWKVLIGRLSRFGLSGLTVGHRVSYNVKANWKLVFQNYNECLHCPSIHPTLSKVLPYKSGANDLISGPFLGGYMEIKAPHQSATMTGRACGRTVSDDLSSADLKKAYYYTFMPNMFLSLHPDYVNYYLIYPIDVDHTRVESEWLFHPETLLNKKDNIKDAVEFWDLTNRQDWDIVERSQLGISSSRYTPGPYSPRESIPAAWDREYLRILKGT